jgi:hypothetical protein
LEEWKKRNRYFLSLSTKYWRMEEDQLKNLRSHSKKYQKAGRMEEAIVVEKENNF